MRKILSLLLAVMILFSFGFTAIAEETTMSVLYTLPTNLHYYSKNKINVNQGEISVIFGETVASGYENITFKDADGNEPKGGIFYEVDGAKVTLKFGELTASTTYTLTVPNTVVGESGATSVAMTKTFVTTAGKEMSDADFSDTTKWPVGKYSVSKKGLFSANTAYTDAMNLYQNLNSYSNGTISIADGFLDLTATTSGNKFIGTHLRTANAVSNNRFVTVMKFAVPTNTASSTMIGGIYTGDFATQLDAGISFSTLTDAGFEKNDDDLYDITIQSIRKEISAKDDQTAVTFNSWVTIIDNISKKTVTKSVTELKDRAVKNSNDAYTYANTVGAVKINSAGSFKIAEIRSGFFTVPAPLSEATKDGKTLTYIVNTDIDVANSTATVGDIPATLSYDETERKLTLTYLGGLTEGQEYAVSFKNILSADGIKGDVVVNYTATETDAYEATYSVISNTYEVDSENLKITNVPAGTSNLEFRANIIVDGDYVVKDADDAEIAEESDAILKEGTKIVLGNDTVYDVVLDFSTPFITAEKYEFITDGEAFDDEENVYDESDSIKVSFDARDFTAIDGGSLNDVSIYETENPENTVAISDSEFDANVLTLNIGGALTAGKNYTLNIQGVKDTVFGRDHTFEKTFTVVATPQVFEVLYTIPNMLTTITNIGVNQEEIKVYFEKDIASGYENITFKDSSDATPVGGIKVSAEGKIVTVEFGELKELETYTLSIPDTLVSTDGKTSVAKDITFTTLKKDLTDVDFSDTTVWTDGAYTTSDLSNKGMPNKFDAAKTTMTIADGALNVKMSAANDLYLGATHDNLATSKVVSFIKFQTPATVTGNPAQNMRLGGVWNGSLGSKFPAHNDTTSTFIFNEGVSYSAGIVAKKFIADENGYYDVTVTSTLEEKSVTDDLTTKTIHTKTVAEDNRSTATATQDNTERQFPVSTTVRTKATSAFKLWNANTFNVKSIKQGFYTVPKLFETSYDEDTKTVSATFNTDMNSESFSGKVKLGGEAVTAVYDAATRTASVTLEKPLSFKDYTLSFDGIKSADGFDFSGETVIKNSFEVTEVKFLNKAGEAVEAFYEDTLKAQFTIKNYGAARDVDVILANYNNNKLVGVNMATVNVDREYTGEITLDDVYYSINGTAKLMLWDGLTALTDTYTINSDETKFVKVDYKDISLLNGEEIITPYNMSGLSSFDLDFTASNYSGESKDIVIEVLVNDEKTKEIPVTVENGISKIKETFSLSEEIAIGDTLEIVFSQGGEQLLKNAFTYTATASYESVNTDLSAYDDKRTVAVNETVLSDGLYYETEFEGTGLEVRAYINGAAMKVYIDGEYKDTVELYSSYVEGSKTAYMISGLSEGKHLIRLEKVGGTALNIKELIVYTRDIRIACVGDSLTYGTGVTTDKSYPGKLSVLMGDGYEVGNFGKPGATVRADYSNTDYSDGYTSKTEYGKSLEFLPDVVYLMFGTNDLRLTGASTFSSAVIAAYKELISAYAALSTAPQIYLHTVPAMQPDSTYQNIDNTSIGNAGKKVYAIGDELNLFVRDMFSETINLSADYYNADGLHFSETGYQVIANKVYNSLCIPKEEISATVCDLKDGKTSLYTFTSDDGYIEAVNWFDKEFEEKGLKGTVVLTCSYIDKTGSSSNYGTVSEWNDVFSRGRFDLASHSKTHVGLTGEGITEETIEDEVTGSKTYLETAFPDQDVLFFGAAGNGVNDAVTAEAKKSYYALRKGQNQFNTLNPTDDEWYSVKFQLLKSDTTLDTMNGWVDTAVSEGKWLMELWHGVEDENYSPPTKANASAHFTYISEQKTMWSATVNEAIKYIKERQNATVTENDVKAGELTVNITDTLPNDIFDYPLSVKVNVPYGTKTVTVYQGKNYKQYSVSGTTAIVDIVPDAGYTRIIAQ